MPKAIKHMNTQCKSAPILNLCKRNVNKPKDQTSGYTVYSIIKQPISVIGCLFFTQ